MVHFEIYSGLCISKCIPLYSLYSTVASQVLQLPAPFWRFFFEASRSDTPSMSNMLKSHKDDGSLNISFDEAMVIHSHHSLVPTIVGSGQGGSRKSELSSRRCHSNASGLADVIEKDLRNVEREVSVLCRCYECMLQ